MLSQQQPQPRARFACLPCRTSKRRCDKSLPHCDLCIRKEIDCVYPARRRTASAAPAGLAPPQLIPQRQDCELSRALLSPLSPAPSCSEAAAMYFIEPRAFTQDPLELAGNDLPVPHNVLSLIGDNASIHNMASRFFASIHVWMPIISKRGFTARLFTSLDPRRAELSLLALCMQLVSCTGLSLEQSSANYNPTALYQAAKKFYRELETAGMLSVQMLQAGILIALYETGHGIYPTAYLTVGACARYGVALGLNTSILERIDGDSAPKSWNELEERRRVWWAILVLDRFMNLSNPSRPLATVDPPFNAFLPVDDSAWDNYTSKPGDSVDISTGFMLKMGRFARLAQATYLLGQALSAVTLPADGVAGRGSSDQNEQLRRTLLSLVHIVDAEADARRLEFCAQSALCFSAILLLQGHHWDQCSSDFNHHPFKKTTDAPWEATREALERMAQASTALVAEYSVNPTLLDLSSPFMIHLTYQVASISIQLSRDPVDSRIMSKIDAFKAVLHVIAQRWKIAGKFNPKPPSAYSSPITNASFFFLDVYLTILKIQQSALSTRDLGA
ncbi:hypothetical protein LX32DRAFT_629892 [Colletotrichum zoysiae]|uniref:Zn(2)-C6 fungal-type domain-containing protein n=1 Tax=Colletotrichum zoysiae TaxID=1216348 RepID=A0AAD9H4Y0_9PEZI|nr:hypothetical protein LX32DRAFT_629892 [Colletotrichum zoysiae]